MSKTTTLSAERDLPEALRAFKDRAAAVKEAHKAARQQIQADPRTSELAKRELLEALAKDTRSKLDAVRADQDSYVSGLRSKIEGELRGNQPSDANSVLLRRDASDRARRVQDKDEAMAVLQDAIANGDAEMAHAIGARARNSVWGDVAEAYSAAHPETAESAQALSYVEANTSGAAFNLSNQISFSDPD
jgi:vacuolar-type H+-ATPase subunit H